MAYLVAKRIKGKLYLYEQSTYRIGGKVHTQSHYIQPLESRDQIEEIYDSAPGQKQRAVARVESTPGNTTKKQTEAPLIVKIDCAKHRISLQALEGEHKRFLGKLQKIGVNTTNFSTIKLTYGKNIYHRKQLFNPIYEVSILKRKEGNRSKLKAEFRKALARAGLDLIKVQRPETYLHIAEAFSRSYQETQAALCRYILNSYDRNRQAKAIVLRWFNQMSPIYRSNLKPEQLGLSDSWEHANWESEFAGVVAEILRKGFSRARSERMGQLKIAMYEEENAAAAWRDAPLISKQRMQSKRRYKRAVARVRANEEMLKKLGIVGKLFLWT